MNLKIDNEVLMFLLFKELRASSNTLFTHRRIRSSVRQE